jgi:hypothetical protein
MNIWRCLWRIWNNEMCMRKLWRCMLFSYFMLLKQPTCASCSGVTSKNLATMLARSHTKKYYRTVNLLNISRYHAGKFENNEICKLWQHTVSTYVHCHMMSHMHEENQWSYMQFFRQISILVPGNITLF